MEANMGGTNIYDPLKNVFDSRVIQGYPRQIFLLTDGEIRNIQEVFKLLRLNLKYSRTHSIGIGEKAS